MPRTLPRPAPSHDRAGSRGRLARLAAGCGAATAVVLGTAGVAAAHVDPDPTSVTAGTQVTVAFGVEHGCDESPTIAMRFKIPAQVTDAKGVAKTGWTIDNQRDVVTFSGGELGHHTEDHFDISFTVPSGVTALDFPVVQECTDGKLEWIAIAQEGQPEPDSPAPRVAVVDASSPTKVSAAGGTATTADADTEHDHADGGTDEHAAEADTTTGGESSVTTVAVAEDGEEAGTSGIVYVVIGAVGVVLVATGVVMQLRRRK